ncbi:MAG: hypothetical protein ACFE8L_02355 [Candidatus Hodarchaeota archaeon]
MKFQRNKGKEDESRPINLVLLACSFIIFGVLGIVFITQMELHPGWAWEEIRDIYPIRLNSYETEDVNGNGHNDIISYADIGGTDRPEQYSIIQYGGVFCLEGSSGSVIWEREYTGPVRNAFPIMNVDGLGPSDYFVSKATISPNWTAWNDHYEPEILLNQYTNHIIDGRNGNDLAGYEFSFTNFYIHDLVSIDNVPDDQYEDLIVIECEEYEVYNPWENRTDIYYDCNLTSYYVNGTKTYSYPVFNASIWRESQFPALELLEFNGQSHVLYLDDLSIVLLNTSKSNFLDPIYNITLVQYLGDYEIIDDVNYDNIADILVSSRNDGFVTVRSGLNGNILGQFAIDPNYNDINLEEIHSLQGDNLFYFLLEVSYWYGPEDEERFMRVYSFDLTTEQLIREVVGGGNRDDFKILVLNEDLNGDLIDEIIYHERYEPLISFNEVRRFTILNPISGKKYAIINTEYHADSIITISDFDGDGKKDFVITGDDRVIALSTQKPVALWLSPAIPYGLPLFIVLTILLAAGIIIVILYGRKLNYRRKSVKEHKLTVVVNGMAIGLMTLTFILFLILMNIFNNTLITNTNNTNIVIAFLVVIITWYGTLPLTAALYNRFAPQFAYVFIKLRDLFFKISRGYKNDILVLDMEGRKEIGLIIKLKRLILPLLLSISVGFYSYDTLTTLLGYPQTFGTFGGTEFFSFMMGYMLCCVLPMILSFVLFSFFVSGNYLLDDAGIVYFRENKKYRQPGDIEPISIWSQSIVKGIAGLSALLTFSTFLTTVDFSGFFGEGDFFMIIFGVLVIVVLFGGIPFLTAFSYVLLAGEVMEECAEENIQKLFNIMEKNGYDTNPHDITNIYPSGFPEKDKLDKLEKAENNL